MFIFGLIVGGALVGGAWYAWHKYGAVAKAAVKAADDFATGIK